jgi:hypothetical protein
MSNVTLFQARQSLAHALRTQDVPGSLIFLSCCDCLDDVGEEGQWLEYEPKSIQLEIRDKIGVNIRPEEFDRLMSAVAVVNTNLAFVSLPSFQDIVKGLDSHTVSVDTPRGQVIDPTILCTGLMEIVLLYPPTETETFNKEIIGYIKEVLRFGGLISYPKIVELIVGSATYNEALVADPDSMAMQADRLEEVQDSLDDWIDNWCRVANTIQFTDGNKLTSIKAMQSFKPRRELRLYG